MLKKCQNQKKCLLSGFVLAAFAVISASCATQPMPNSLKPVLDKGPVKIELNPEMNYTDITNYSSRSLTKTYSNGQITKKITEGVDFSVETKVISVDEVNKLREFKVTTLSKDGKMDISDFAMPELGESLDFVLSSTGQVLKVSGIPPGTLYYIPPVSLPKSEVSVGDTWPMTAEWVSLKSGSHLKLDIVSILKSLRDCGKAGRCAEIELSGNVKIVGAESSSISSQPAGENSLPIRFRSEMRGKILVSLKNGTVLYSILRSDENMMNEKDSVQISSCMMSFVKEPVNEKIVSPTGGSCDPTGEIPTL